MDGIKIRENKDANGINSARFYISYSGKGNSDAHRKKSFEIISKLKGDREMFIELKSSLLSMDIYKREKCATDFLKSVKDLGLNFRSRKVPSKESMSFLAKLFTMGAAPKDSYEIISHIPSSTWNDYSFKEIIPYYGVFYYICKESPDAVKLMEDLFNGQVLDEEKLDLFEFFIYDCIDFGQMGVFTNGLDISGIEQLLK